MLAKQCNEPFAMRRFQQVDHFVNHYIFDKIFRLFDQFGVQANVSCAVIAAAPFCLHALKEIGIHSYAKPGFPFFN